MFISCSIYIHFFPGCKSHEKLIQYLYLIQYLRFLRNESFLKSGLTLRNHTYHPPSSVQFGLFVRKGAFKLHQGLYYVTSFFALVKILFAFTFLLLFLNWVRFIIKSRFLFLPIYFYNRHEAARQHGQSEGARVGVGLLM